MSKTEELIFNGYMRLLGFMNGVYIPKRCRVCSCALTPKYLKRDKGYLCLACLREKRRK